MNQGTDLKFSDILKRERSKQGFAFSELSRHISKIYDGEQSLSPSYLSRLEGSGNQYDNPSIKSVLMLIESLNLNIKEVIKSFGFKNLAGADKEWKIGTIEELIRNSEIMAPLENTDMLDGSLLFQLSIKEKEILINIINSIFEIGVCNEENMFLELDKTLKGIGKYRSIRKEKIESRCLKEETFESIYGENNIIITEKIKERIYKSLFVTPQDIIDTIFENQEYMKNIEGLFEIKIKNSSALLSIRKENDLICLIDIYEPSY